MAREVLSNGVINPDKYQADWYADLSNNWNLLNNLIGSAISSSEVDSKIATAIQELMVRTFQIVAELPVTGTEGVMYLVSIPNTSKYTAYVWENNAYRELGVIQMTITVDDELSTTSENPAQNKVITNALNNKAPISHTHSASDITSGLATVATSGSYNDLSNKPAIPSKTSDLTNDSGFITSDNTKIPLAGSNAISGSLIPATTNAYDLGGSSYQWNNAYIKSLTINGVACGDILTHNVNEFVDVTSNQIIGGVKTFKQEVTMFGRDINLMSRLHYGKNSNPSVSTWQYLFFRGNTAIEGYTDAWYSGFLEQYIDTTGTTRGRWLVRDTSESAVSVELFVSGNNKQVRPMENNAVDLGTSTNKWKTINGINPGALSLPSTSSNVMIQIDTTSWVLDGVADIEYTPLADGYLALANDNKLEWVKGQIQNDNYYGIYRFVYKYDSDIGGIQGVTIPCIKGKKVIMKIKGTGFYNALFTYCQGNV